jgi:hypothetical protein
MVGVGALVTKKKLKCQRCGEYNDTGNGKPYEGPAGRKYKKEWKAEQEAAGSPAAMASEPADVAAKLAQLAELHNAGSLTDEEFAEAKSALLS